jgi:amidophosphoribosyltransferase
MLNEVKDECGIVAVADLGVTGEPPADAARLVPAMLLDIQNRGQLAAGLTSYRADRPEILRTHKDTGSVSEVFTLSDKENLARIQSRLAGSVAIGHTRYATCGADDAAYAQPLERIHGKPFKWFSFCFNGNIANHGKLADHLRHDLGYHLTRPDSDTELFMHLIAFQQRGEEQTPWVEAFSNLIATVDGAWSLAMVTATGELIVARDPTGLKPLCYGRRDRFMTFASESIALQNAGVTEIKAVKPGTMIRISPDGKIHEERFAPERPPRHCFFEWVYFANVASELDDRSVYQARSNFGKMLAKTETETITDDHLVVPVPDTSKAAGDSFAFALGIPSIEGLVRNRYLGRTFIETEDRMAKIKRKFTALHGVLQGKKVFLVDDSIVRLSTMTYLIDYMRKEGGVKELHVRIACPPIMAPCFYGIDMSTIGELFGPKYLKSPIPHAPLPAEDMQHMAEFMGADSLRYLPVESVPDSIGLPFDHLCMACVTTDYPTPTGQELYQQAVAAHREGRPTGRMTTG